MVYNISETLKTARKENGYSVQEALERLAQYGISISSKTLYGYESGHRQPDSDTLIALCKIYGIESFARFVGMISDNDAVSEEEQREQKLLLTFRLLNQEGQEKLLDILDDMIQSNKYIKSGSARLDQKEA